MSVLLYKLTNDPNTLNFPHVEAYKISFTKNITHIKQLFKQNGVGTGVKLAWSRGVIEHLIEGGHWAPNREESLSA